jgi:hypothetical protein
MTDHEPIECCARREGARIARWRDMGFTADSLWMTLGLACLVCDWGGVTCRTVFGWEDARFAPLTVVTTPPTSAAPLPDEC